MIPRWPLSRRDALRWLAAAFLWLRVANAEARRAPDRSVPRLLRRVFRSLRSSAAVGREFLRKHPEEANPERLAGLIGLALARRDPKAWDRWFVRHRREDFRQDRVVEIGGWIFALSEARLCAFAALAPTTPSRHN